MYFTSPPNVIFQGWPAVHANWIFRYIFRQGVFNPVQLLLVNKGLILTVCPLISNLKSICTSANMIQIILKPVNLICIKSIVLIGLVLPHILKSNSGQSSKAMSRISLRLPSFGLYSYILKKSLACQSVFLRSLPHNSCPSLP